MVDVCYDLSDFINIAFKKDKFTLKENTINSISELNDQFSYMNVKEISSSSIDSKKSFKNKMSRNNSYNSMDKTFTIKSQKSPIKKDESNISKIRFLLNKISESNYQEVNSSLVDLINRILLDNKEETELTTISTLIFHLASTNSFYSKLYANLFTNLLNNFEFLRSCFLDTFNSHKDIFSSFRSADPSIDYNLYCMVNKENDIRKAISKFFVNLAINKIIEEKEILNFMDLFLSKIDDLINIDNNSDQVNEIVENIFIFYQKDFINIVEDKVHLENIISKIKFYANAKSKDYKSLSAKSVFKFMDLLEK